MTVTVSVTVTMSFEVHRSSGGLSTYIPKKVWAKKAMLNFSRWPRTFGPCAKWDSPKVQKMTHIAKFILLWSAKSSDMLELWVKVIWAKVGGI